MQALRSPIPAEHKVAYAASMILHTCWETGQLELSNEIRALIHPLLATETISPMTRFLWGISEFFYNYWFSDQPLTDSVTMREIRDLGLKHGLTALWPLYQAATVYIAVSEGDNQEARNIVAEMEKGIANRPDTCKWEKGHYHSLAAVTNLTEEKHDQALEHAEQSLSCAMGVHEPGQLYCHQILAHIYLARAEHLKALLHFSAARRISKLYKSNNSEFSLRVFLCRFAFHTGRYQRGLNLLRAAFLLGKEKSYSRYLFQAPAELAELCAIALDENIEPDYAKHLIQVNNLRPPDNSLCRNWPWPVKIHALGTLHIEVNDQPLVFEGKAQAKPLAMLRELITNNGAPLRTEQIADSLWPDSNDEKNKANIKTTLQRLRKLLGNESILLSNGQLRFNPDQCWLDTIAFKKHLDTALNGNNELSVSQLESALKLYRGPLLQDSDQSIIDLPQRENLQHLFIHGLLLLTENLIKLKKFEPAIDWLQNGIEIDPLSEMLCQKLIEIYLKLNLNTDALRIYRNCKAQLDYYVKAKPSPAIQKLIDNLN